MGQLQDLIQRLQLTERIFLTTHLLKKRLQPPTELFILYLKMTTRTDSKNQFLQTRIPVTICINKYVEYKNIFIDIYVFFKISKFYLSHPKLLKGVLVR